ncbi:MAG TPA: flavin reductase family protein [Pusillimonas sp.]|uniref:flavin reductase family protein n=1 Tax=unclassified Pusillimonas TaxID=2640016 RepID=UPI00261A5137|nr:MULTISPECIES: flavin reductase family protein [unclassified Pusillimonas]HLU20204.1 flavin reductase family protein [Pusillimonas sp.]
MTANAPDFDDAYFRSALGRFPSGVTIVMTQSQDDTGPVGLTISSFSSVSLDPPLVSWTLAKKAASLAHFEHSQRYVIHVLSATQLPLARKFASGPQAERFSGVELSRSPSGVPMLEPTDCAAWFECYNVCRHDAGDHVLFIGQVERCGRTFHQPLVYHAGDFDLTPSNQPLSDH